MFKGTAFAFIAAMLAAALAAPSLAADGCESPRSTQSVDTATPETSSSIADSSTRSGTQQGK